MSLFKNLFSKKSNQSTIEDNDDRPTAFQIKYVGPSPYQKPFKGSGYGVVFEDDGETGYFYATDESQTIIFDAMALYNVNTSGQINSEDQIFIVWNSNLQKAGIYYRDKFQAIVDFKNQKACCRSGLPAKTSDWCKTNHNWDESMIEGLEK